MLPTNVLYYGKSDPLPERHPLQAGPLLADFENGELLNIRWRGQEILRRIYVAVRDRSWGTAPIQISNLRIQRNSDAFHVAFEAQHRQDEIDFAWSGRIDASAGGKLTCSMDGEARSTFLRSRIGFCLLHAVEQCAGRSFEVLRPDATSLDGCFPVRIAREQPIAATNAMAALAYDISPALRLHIRFEGDVFQMEDQRNWTDATFKTFCTPLELPCPVEIQRGDRVSQKISLTLEERRPPAVISARDQDIVVTIGPDPAVRLPELGLCIASHGEPLSGKEVQRLRALGLAHLRADVRLAEPDWTAVLRRACVETRELGCALEAAVFVSDSAEEELRALRNAVEREQPRISRWLIFHQSELATSERWILLARKFLESWDSSAGFGSGANAYFHELAGFRAAAGKLDCCCFSIQPQEHMFDNASLVETLAMQRAVVENARALHGLPVAVSPVTLKARFNPNATGPENPPLPGELPRQVDVRQMSLFGAAWTLGSLKHLSESGAASITYYETTGWRGVMERETGPPLPNLFPSLPGAVFPLYHVIADVCAFAGGEVLSACSSEPLEVSAMVVRRNGRRRALAANTTGERLRVAFHGLPDRVELAIRDEASALDCMTHPQEFRGLPPDPRNTDRGALVIDLSPWSVVRLDEAATRA